MRHPEEQEPLKKLWAEAFGDTRTFIDAFFRQLGTKENTYVLEQEGEIAAMCVLLPGVYEEEAVWYVYGVATGTPFRHKGYFHQLMSEIKALAKERQVQLCLVPAKGLVPLYEPLGFYTKEVEEKWICDLEPGKEGSIAYLHTGEEYARLQEKTPSIDKIRLCRAYVQFAVQDCLDNGGIAGYKKEDPGKYFVGEKAEGQLLLQESTWEREDWTKYGGQLASEKGITSVVEKGHIWMGNKEWKKEIFSGLNLS